jgi:type I restriction enzyme, S subunit
MHEAFGDKGPEQWHAAKLGEVASCTLGGTPSTDVPMFWGGDVPWMASGDVHLRKIHDVPGRITAAGLGASNATLVRPPAVAVGLAGQGKTRGTVALTLCELSTNQSIALFRGDGLRLHTEYLFHNLDRRYEELRARSSGGGRGGLSKGILEDVPIDLPPLPEQKATTEILDTLDTTIRQTEAIIEKLQLLKQGLLHDLLTRGIDANGELRPPQSQAPHRYKDSPLGWIPRKWTSPTIRWVVAEVANGASIRADEFRPAGTPVIAKGDVTKAKYIDTNRRIQFVASALATSKYKGSMINREFVVCSMRDLVPSAPTLGMASMLDAELDGLLAQGTTALRLYRSRFHAELFVEVTRLPWFRTRMRALAVGSTQVHMRGRDYLDVVIPAPPIEEQQEIVARVRAVDQSLEAHHESAKTLKTTKSGLMDDLLTGRVRVTSLLVAATA